MKIVPSETPIAMSDRAFNYGDGVFTTMCISDHTPQLLPWHIDRLQHDANTIGLSVDKYGLAEAINQYVADVKRSSEHGATFQYVLKVHISGGEAGRGYGRDEQNPPIVRISQHIYPSHYPTWRESGMTLMCAQTPLAVQPLLAGVKHMNRLEQVLIKQEISRSKVDDAVVCDTNGHVIEASAGNIFFYANGAWHTPSLKGSGVNGVVRQCLVQALLNEDNLINVGAYALERLRDAQIVVVTNALMGIVPIKEITFPDGAVQRYSCTANEIEHLRLLLSTNLYNTLIEGA